jgi:murein DD-endopeptidase MepM/ murein hydrolase activator NlpD
MSTPLKLETADLEGTASALRDLSHTTTQLSATLNSAWGQLDGGWHSYCREDANVYFRHVMTELKHMEDMLTQMGGALHGTATLVQAADDEAALYFVWGAGQGQPQDTSPRGGGGITAPPIAQPEGMTWEDWIKDWVDWLLGRGKYADPPNIEVTIFPTPTPPPTQMPPPATQLPATDTPAPTATPTPAPITDVQFSSPPVPLTGNTFVNGFGPIAFAQDNQSGLYQGTSGLHGGIDLGVAGGTEVKAGVYGEIVDRIINDANSPGGNVVIKVGDKYVIYGHTEALANLKPGDLVTPDTVLGKIYTWTEYDANGKPFDNSHLHLTVLEELPGDQWRAHNPALLFSGDTVLPSGLSATVEGHAEIESFIYSGEDNYWDNPDNPDLGIIYK